MSACSAGQFSSSSKEWLLQNIGLRQGPGLVGHSLQKVITGPRRASLNKAPSSCLAGTPFSLIASGTHLRAVGGLREGDPLLLCSTSKLRQGGHARYVCRALAPPGNLTGSLQLTGMQLTELSTYLGAVGELGGRALPLIPGSPLRQGREGYVGAFGPCSHRWGAAGVPDRLG